MQEVLAEHLEYLTLPGRSELYIDAINHIVSDGDRIADLGCGVGVLGLFCLNAGAAEVWGIDSSDAIHLARETFEKVGLADRYHCIAQSTFHAQLPDRVDVIICDHVGFFGFDYGIIEMVRDARERFLKPGGKVIPQSMDLHVAAVSSNVCRDKVASWLDQSIPAEFRWFDGYYRNAKHHHNFTFDELNSQPVRLGQIKLDQDNPEMFAFEANLSIQRAGRFDGFAGWFDCLLGGNVRMTNSPLDPATINRPQAFFPVIDPFQVEAGDTVKLTIRFRHDVGMIAWTFEPPGDAPRQKLSTWEGTVLTPADLIKTSDRPMSLSQMGMARAFVLEQVDGQRTAEQIVQIVLSKRPDLLPSDIAIRDFVHAVLAQDCNV